MKKAVILLICLFCFSYSKAEFTTSHAIKYFSGKTIYGFDFETEIEWDFTESSNDFGAFYLVYKTSDKVQVSMKHIGLKKVLKDFYYCESDITLDLRYKDFSNALYVKDHKINSMKISKIKYQEYEELLELNYFIKSADKHLNVSQYANYGDYIIAPLTAYGIKYNDLNDIKKNRKEIFKQEFIEAIKAGCVNLQKEVILSTSISKASKTNIFAMPTVKLKTVKVNTIKYEIK